MLGAADEDLELAAVNAQTIGAGGGEQRAAEGAANGFAGGDGFGTSFVGGGLSVHHARSIRRGEELLVDWESIVCRLFWRRLSTRRSACFQERDAPTTRDLPAIDAGVAARTTPGRCGRRNVDCLSILSAANIYARFATVNVDEINQLKE